MISVWRRTIRPVCQMSGSVLPVAHNPDKSEFTISIPGHEPAYLRYQNNSDLMTMYTTVVPPSLEGRGVAKLLANAAFDFAVETQREVSLTCWYLSGYLKRHPRDDLMKLIK